MTTSEIRWRCLTKGCERFLHPEVPTAWVRRSKSHLRGPAGFIAVPQVQWLPDWTDFSHSVSSKRVWIKQPPSPRSHGEKEKFTAVCFGSGVLSVQRELLCPKIPRQGARCTRQSPRSSSQRAAGNINALSASDFPAKIQRESLGKATTLQVCGEEPPNEASWLLQCRC